MKNIGLIFELSIISDLNNRKAYIDTLAFADLIGLLNESVLKLQFLDVYEYTMIKLLEIYKVHIETGIFQNNKALYSEVATRILSKAILWEHTKITNFLNEL